MTHRSRSWVVPWQRRMLRSATSQLPLLMSRSSWPDMRWTHQEIPISSHHKLSPDNLIKAPVSSWISTGGPACSSWPTRNSAYYYAKYALSKKRNHWIEPDLSECVSTIRWEPWFEFLVLYLRVYNSLRIQTCGAHHLHWEPPKVHSNVMKELSI